MRNLGETSKGALVESSGGRSAASHANAELHGVGLFVAIAALAVSCFAAGIAFMVSVHSRDQVEDLKGEIIRVETQLKDVEIEFDEFKKDFFKEK